MRILTDGFLGSAVSDRSITNYPDSKFSKGYRNGTYGAFRAKSIV
jgi:hypothetical protein